MEVLINGKKINKDEDNVYKENVRIEFDGFAILIRRDNRNRLKELKNIEPGYVEKKNGKYQLIVNDEVLINFSIKKRVIAIIIFILFVFISFFIGYFYKNYSYSPKTYLFNSSEIQLRNIKLINSYEENNILKRKIAPGTEGSFEIIINDDFNINMCRFTYVENTDKPDGLYFKIENNVFYNMIDLITYLNKDLKTFTRIEWKWDYIGNDEIDTYDGINGKEYSFDLILFNE